MSIPIFSNKYKSKRVNRKRPICICKHKNYHHTYTKTEYGNGTYRGKCRRCNCEVFEVP